MSPLKKTSSRLHFLYPLFPCYPCIISTPIFTPSTTPPSTIPIKTTPTSPSPTHVLTPTQLVPPPPPISPTSSHTSLSTRAHDVPIRAPPPTRACSTTTPLPLSTCSPPLQSCSQTSTIPSTLLTAISSIPVHISPPLPLLRQADSIPPTTPPPLLPPSATLSIKRRANARPDNAQ